MNTNIVFNQVENVPFENIDYWTMRILEDLDFEITDKSDIAFIKASLRAIVDHNSNK